MLPPALTGTFIRRQGCPHDESEIIAQPDLSLPHSSQNTSQNAFLHTFQAPYFLFSKENERLIFPRLNRKCRVDCTPKLRQGKW